MQCLQIYLSKGKARWQTATSHFLSEVPCSGSDLHLRTCSEQKYRNAGDPRCPSVDKDDGQRSERHCLHRRVHGFLSAAIPLGENTKIGRSRFLCSPILPSPRPSRRMSPLEVDSTEEDFAGGSASRFIGRKAIRSTISAMTITIMAARRAST